MVKDLEENPDNHNDFNIEIRENNIKKPKGEKLQTKIQIFKYSYGQIEKEKALQEQSKNLTISGIISRASDIEIRTRPPIEVCFKDLTLTLKGKNKHQLRCVSGKLLPSSVSAVMGPSGAGKTTFLLVLTGKAAGYTVTGVILINGKPKPVQSYKKIIGFVPQDDKVHENLTMEENLWFSARCRGRSKNYGAQNREHYKRKSRGIFKDIDCYHCGLKEHKKKFYRKLKKENRDKEEKNEDNDENCIATVTIEDLVVVLDENLINIACDESS
ncbi:hypothetical protein FXO38_28883 [Capsicum annuum]|nr:hypothetical protein FXO38_28883 [Capsicum annuum]